MVVVVVARVVVVVAAMDVVDVVGADVVGTSVDVTVDGVDPLVQADRAMIPTIQTKRRTRRH